jgi:hypothetical protein
VHPHTHTFESLKNGGFHSDGQLKCDKGNVKHFERAILLIRCILSMFVCLFLSSIVFRCSISNLMQLKIKIAVICMCQIAWASAVGLVLLQSSSNRYFILHKNISYPSTILSLLNLLSLSIISLSSTYPPFRSFSLGAPSNLYGPSSRGECRTVTWGVSDKS